MEGYSFKAIEHIESFNKLIVKMNASKAPINEPDLKSGLKKCGMPSNVLFIMELRKCGILEKINKGYRWINNSPIHFRALDSIYAQYHKKVMGYYYVKLRKSKNFEELERKKVKEAISLLKDKGFVLFAPTGNLYEKL